MPAHAVFPLMLIRTAGLPLSALELLAVSWQTVDEAVLVGGKQHTDAILALQGAFDRAFAELPESPLRTSVYQARQAFFQRQQLPHPEVLQEFIARNDIPAIAGLTPSIEGYITAQEALNQARDAYRQQYEKALQQGYTALQQIAGSDHFQRALLFASHSLLEQIPRFCQTPVECFAKKERQIALSVLQYVTRMAVKTSPLSRFTTVSVQPVDPETASAGLSGEFSLNKAVITPNVTLLEAIYVVLLREPVFYRSLSVQLNPCIVSASENQYRWLFYNGEQESVQAAQADPVLTFIIEFLLGKDRQLPISDLLAHLSTEIEADVADLEAYILRLVDIGILEWVLPENGMTPGWCSGLYQYLGFLPAEPRIVQTATLLQWLRTTARTLPYQTLREALESLKETKRQIALYFEQVGVPAPVIPPEQLFFEDVQQVPDISLPAERMADLCAQLAECRNESNVRNRMARQSGLFHFFVEVCPKGGSIPFMEFSRRYLEQRSGEAANPGPLKPVTRQTPDDPANCTRLQIGVLIQPYTEKGQQHAVVNGLYAGGGKMFARWLHLFPAAVQQVLLAWATQGNQTAFPWQGWFNANMQPALTATSLSVPGGRLPRSKQNYLAGNLELVNETGKPLLRDQVSGHYLHLSDLGLEAPETKPPVMKLLWQLGVPGVSLEDLLPENLWEPLYDPSIRYRARHTFRNLVLARAAWAVEPSVWNSWLARKDAVEFFSHTRQALRAMGVPRHFFARFAAVKPQYFDRDSPLLFLLFQKTIKQGNGVLYLTEMLPGPGHLKTEAYATELVVEISL